MSEDEKIVTVGTLGEPIETNDPTADELVVMDLQKQIKELEAREVHLQYSLSGASDVLRMNTAARILSAIVSAKKLVLTDSDKTAAIATSVDLADRLATHYQAIIEKNAVEYQKRVAAMDQDDGDDDTVQ